MSRASTDSEALIAAFVEEAKAGAGEHPETELLLDYHAATLPAESEQEVRNHLARCPRCARVILDLESFAAAAAEPPSTVPNLAAAAAWRDFRAKFGEPMRPAGRRPLPPSLYAAAATLMLGVAGLSFWVTRLEGVNANLRRTVAEFSVPKVDPPLIQLDALTRSEEAGGLRVEIPPDQPYLLVIVIPGTTELFPLFETELLDAEDREIWREASELSESETLRFSLPRQLLPAGDYRIVVHGVDGDRRVPVIDRRLAVR